MKNSFKIGFLALAIAVSAVACKGKGGAGSADSAKMGFSQVGFCRSRFWLVADKGDRAVLFFCYLAGSKDSFYYF